MLDTSLVRSLTEHVADVLAEERLHVDTADATISREAELDLARAVLRSEIARISAKRPLDAWPPIDEESLMNDVLARVLGLGGLEALLDDPDVSAATRFSRTEKRFDAGTPELNMQLPDGSRLFAVMEVSTRPSLVIRRHRFELSSLDELRALDVFDADVQALLTAMVRSRRNVVVAGGTGSGKTTLLRALLNEVPPTERIVTIEDAYELGLEHFAEKHPDYDALQSRSANIEGEGEVTLADLTRMALRMDPDRVIVGEVRGAEAFPMLMAMSQGNNGSMCTMHADGTRSVFPKLAAYVSMASTGLPVETVNVLVSSALHFVIFIENVDGRRRIASIREVVDTDGNNIVSNEILTRVAGGQTQWPFPIRSGTRELLEQHGFGRPVMARSTR